MRVGNREGSTKVMVDGDPMPMRRFQADKATLFPDLIFGYYSGTGRRLEKLFDDQIGEEAGLVGLKPAHRHPVTVNHHPG